jgi:hypothetical protein
VAAAKKNQRMQSKSATGGGSSTIESNPVMDSMLLEFHKFIQKWEPKFEKWDQMWDNNKEDRITVQEVPTEGDANPKETEIVVCGGELDTRGNDVHGEQRSSSEEQSNSHRLLSSERESLENILQVHGKSVMEDDNHHVVGVLEQAIPLPSTLEESGKGINKRNASHRGMRMHRRPHGRWWKRSL